MITIVVTMKNIINTSLALALLLSFFSAISLRYYYTQCMLGFPVVQQSRVVPVDVFYGKIVYVTANEKQTLYITYLSTTIMVVAYVLAYTLSMKKGQTKFHDKTFSGSRHSKSTYPSSPLI